METMTDSGAQAKKRFERLISPVRGDLVRFAHWWSKDPELADDVVQETLIRAWRSFHQLKDDRRLKPWLITIARREHARNFERKRLDVKSIEDLAASESHYLSVCDTSDLRELRAAILSLDAMYREPLYLQVVMGFSMKEISASMGICVATVASRLRRARQKLCIE